jgi:hypothetical protein
MAVETHETIDLNRMLQQDVERSHGNTDVEKLVLKYGRSFTPAPCPKGFRQRAKKGCFSNSLTLAGEERAIYVQGFALRIVDGRRISFPHAWNTHDGVTAFDTTLKNNSGVRYLGIAIPTNLAVEEYFNGQKIPFLDARKSFERMEELLQLAFNSPPQYGKFKQGDE